MEKPAIIVKRGVIVDYTATDLDLDVVREAPYKKKGEKSLMDILQENIGRPVAVTLRFTDVPQSAHLVLSSPESYILEGAESALKLVYGLIEADETAWRDSILVLLEKTIEHYQHAQR